MDTYINLRILISMSESCSVDLEDLIHLIFFVLDGEKQPSMHQIPHALLDLVVVRHIFCFGEQLDS